MKSLSWAVMPLPYDTVIICFEYTDVQSWKDQVVIEVPPDAGDALATATPLI